MTKAFVLVLHQPGPVLLRPKEKLLPSLMLPFRIETIWSHYRYTLGLLYFISEGGIATSKLITALAVTLIFVILILLFPVEI